MTMGAIAAVDVLRDARVLLVDDEHLTLRTLERTLRTEGAIVSSARSLEDARVLMQTKNFDAGVVDLCLSDACGTSVVNELRTSEQPCGALIITGSRGMDAARESVAAGAEEFLLKPFEVGAFLQAVARTIERTREWRSRLADRSGEQHEEYDEGTTPPIVEPGPDAVDAAPAERPPVVLELVPPPAADAGTNQKTKMIGWPSLPTLGLLDIEVVADELARLGELSSRERSILVHILRGHHNNEIAQELGATERTIKFHVSNILKKLHITGRGDLLRLFFKP